MSETLVTCLRDWLGVDGGIFFKSLYEAHGKLCVVLPGKVPHPVHFREGMTVRNWLRSQPECEGWTDHDYDDRWEGLVLEALGLKPV